jgi:tRNA(Ile2) C34 agmatinyltransferase TiaS
METISKDAESGDAGNLPEQKLRRCLMCGQMFPSAGPGNRICKKCKSTQAWQQG